MINSFMIHSVYKTINLINQKYYIGKHSSENPNDEYLGSGKALLNAIKKYGLINFRKEVLFLFENEIDAYNKETEILQEIDGVNDPLCYNLCYGGVGFWKGSSHSDETKRKISEGNRGKIRSADAKKRYSESKKGCKLTEETKQKIKLARSTQIITEETKKKISQSSLGRVQTVETRKKISEAHLGKESSRKGTKCSYETRQKMSFSQKGKIVSEETREKLRKLTKEKNSQFGSMWITNGDKNMKIMKDESIPVGWYKGRFFAKGDDHVRD